MKIMTYNVMEGGVKPDSSRLEKVLGVINEQAADVVGLQETLVVLGRENQLLSAVRDAGVYGYDAVFDGEHDWAQTTGVALFSKRAPHSARVVGTRVKAVEMRFPAVQSRGDELSICNVYLSHLSEAVRRPQIEEVLRELGSEKYGIILGDFNSLSPEDRIPQSAVASFSERMKEKYCRDGQLCYDTIEAVLNAGYVDVGLQFYQPEAITGQTDLSGGTGNHTRPMRMDFIFATPELLPYVDNFVMVKEGLARTASDHFPWYVVLGDSAAPTLRPVPK